MKVEQYFKNLSVPCGKIDAVLDTDAYNEVDDQFAIAYMLKSKEKINVKAIYAAPFFNFRVNNCKEGMERSYDEIKYIMELAKENVDVYKGSETYLKSETEYVESEAAKDLCERAEGYSSENPLYVVSIGAITNIASALLMKPEIKDKIVVVWLAGHGMDYKDTNEFNMMQDIAAARIIFGCGVPLVHLPAFGVVSHFAASQWELKHHLCGKSTLCDYLYENVVQEAESYAKGKPWTRIIWDVVAVAWLLNDDNKFMKSRIQQTQLPEYDFSYSHYKSESFLRYVYYIKRDAIMEDLVNKLTGKPAD